MTARDRTVIMVVALAVVLGAVWIGVVSPERTKAGKLTAQIAAARSQLASAEQQLGGARGAESRYAAAYTSIVNLGKAVPTTAEVPSLIYQLEQASNEKRVDFSAITTSGAGSGAGSGASSGASSAAGASAGVPTSATSTFTQLPFTLTFTGGFFELEQLFRKLSDLTTLAGSAHVAVSGRLLTVQSVKLAPADDDGLQDTSALTGTITADAYVLPASQGLTAGASPSSPSAAATPASSSGGASSPTTPAIVKASTP